MREIVILGINIFFKNQMFRLLNNPYIKVIKILVILQMSVVGVNFASHFSCKSSRLSSTKRARKRPLATEQRRERKKKAHRTNRHRYTNRQADRHMNRQT